jgi:hypothetical protein
MDVHLFAVHRDESGAIIFLLGDLGTARPSKPRARRVSRCGNPSVRERFTLRKI